MIEAVIRACIAGRVLVAVFAVALALGGLWAVRETPVDAIPDLSDVQVIVKTSLPGQAPQVVEDQVTYPLSTALLSVPGAVTVRGYSFFGDSYVYVIFEDGTDLYWARSRVLEYLSQAAGDLPEDARPALGPDATGVGWVYSYALLDRSGRHDLGDLRAIQDFYLAYELQAVQGVSEVAPVGGMVRQYQVVVDPVRLRAYELPLAHIGEAIRRANGETGASVIEMAEAEYIVRASGYLQGIESLRDVPLGRSVRGTPLTLGDVADVRMGPQMRRGIADLDGEGEVVGAIVVMRSGENAARTIEAVKARLEELKAGLPEGVEIVTTYDRSTLIERAIDNLYGKLVEEFATVALICALFLLHLRSSLVILISLPLGILAAYLIMSLQGLNANIMSLGGIAIAIGAMVDGAIVMIENLHKHIERTPLTDANRWELVAKSASEVGPALFFSLLIITLSFVPIFSLEGQEGRLFAPLAFTKTWAMFAAAVLAITVVPVLLGWLVRGRIRTEQSNPLNRAIHAAYAPILEACMRMPKTVVLVAVALTVIGLWPLRWVGSEFMPPLDEGDLLYMPTTYAGLSVGKARELLQQTDRLIATVPEVERVFGKAGRAETATDPAPLTMFETVVMLKPRDQWRPGLTLDDLKRELDALVAMPGLSNAWVMPIRTRIDMLATGIRTPVGIKVAGPELAEIERIGRRLEAVIPQVEGTASVYSERVVGGRYLKVDIDRYAAARFGLDIADVQSLVRTAIGGMNVTQTVEGRQRFPVNLRYPQAYRDSPEALRQLPVVTASGQQVVLDDVADIFFEAGPPAIKSENARLQGWTYVDIEGRDLGSYVQEAQRVVAEQVDLPPGYSIAWSGQYEYLVRAAERLSIIVPITLMVIVLLLWLNFRRLRDVLLILATVPFALIGGVGLIFGLGYDLSVAMGVGFIALAGVAVEIGILMVMYLNRALADAQADTTTREVDLLEVVREGAGRRVRPILMTSTATIAGLVPIMFGSGTGSEVMQRIAAPMIGGMVSTLVLTLLVLPMAWLLVHRWLDQPAPAVDGLADVEEVR
ncbi:MAG TPA: CusA/CzcA family heavy metal efflux RND transporter [Pseudomonadales bacterium]|nr:CusA/CzcA family heavy metal efflux RND transporter [Pseudomonadales bacterium]